MCYFLVVMKAKDLYNSTDCDSKMAPQNTKENRLTLTTKDSFPVICYRLLEEGSPKRVSLDFFIPELSSLEEVLNDFDSYVKVSSVHSNPNKGRASSVRYVVNGQNVYVQAGVTDDNQKYIRYCIMCFDNESIHDDYVAALKQAYFTIMQPFFKQRFYNIGENIEQMIEQATLDDIKRGRFRESVTQKEVNAVVDAYLGSLPRDICEQRKMITDDLLEQMSNYRTAFARNDRALMRNNEKYIRAYTALLADTLWKGFGRKLIWSPDEFLKDPSKPIKGL